MSDKKQAILAELNQIRGNAPVIEPEAVVRYASDPDTALHGEFEWDDSKAGHQHRLWQARQVLRVYIKVVDTGDGKEVPVRMFYNIVDEETSRGYMPIEDVLSDEDRRLELISGQLERLWNIYKSYPLPELKPVARAIETCRRKFLPAE